MKILYLDCAMGAAGDMLSAALMQLCPDPERILQGINALHLPGIEVCLEESRKCGIAGAHYAVKIHGEEENQVRAPHRHGLHLHEIQEIIDRSGLPEEVCENSRAVYRLLAEAESRVHGKKAEHIHFHEVGTLDAIVDILTVCLLIHELNPERICASAIHLGSGTVKCAHGELPVPAPATAELLRGIPAYTADIQGELCTPTGAALLKHFVDQFGPMPEIAAEKIGYGMGMKDFPRPNCVRAVIGEAQNNIIELCCNVDDMSGEAVGYAVEKLMEEGALDVSWQPIGMKKSRPGMRLAVMCKVEEREKTVRNIFKYTSTIGIRETLCQRYILWRENKIRETDYGPVRVKISSGYGVKREKAEYEDLKRLADELNIPVTDALRIVEGLQQIEDSPGKMK